MAIKDQVTNEEVQDFFTGYEDATIGSRIPDGIYHLRCMANLGETTWSSEDKPVVQVEIEVDDGDHAESLAPRLNLQLGGFEYTKNGKVRKVKGEEIFKNLQGTVRAIHGSEQPAVDPAMTGVDLLSALADAILGDDFVATVVTDKKGFQNLRNITGMDNLPADFVLASDLEEMSV